MIAGGVAQGAQIEIASRLGDLGSPCQPRAV